MADHGKGNLHHTNFMSVYDLSENLGKLNLKGQCSCYANFREDKSHGCKQPYLPKLLGGSKEPDAGVSHSLVLIFLQKMIQESSAD